MISGMEGTIFPISFSVYVRIFLLACIFAGIIWIEDSIVEKRIKSLKYQLVISMVVVFWDVYGLIVFVEWWGPWVMRGF